MQNLDSDNIYQKILEMFGKIPENFSILEEQIDIKTQLNYFDWSKKYKQNPESKKSLPEIKQKVTDPDLSIDELKDLLVQLANYEDVEAFRILEKYVSDSGDELKEWAILAMQENRMGLESALLDENQVIISTGLGGKGKKLRYFVVIGSRNDQVFTALQQKLVIKELEFALRKNEGEVEKVEFDESYCTLLTVVPLNISIKEIIHTVIEECNQIGNFIDTRFIVTNVKVFSKEEIRNSWKNI